MTTNPIPGGYTTYILGTGTCHREGYRSPDIGIRNRIDFHNFSIKNGINFQDFGMKYKVGYTISKNWIKVRYTFSYQSNCVFYTIYPYQMPKFLSFLVLKTLIRDNFIHSLEHFLIGIFPVHDNFRMFPYHHISNASRRSSSFVVMAF